MSQESSPHSKGQPCSAASTFSSNEPSQRRWLSQPAVLLKINFKVNRCNVHLGKPTVKRENRSQRSLNYTTSNCWVLLHAKLFRDLLVFPNMPHVQSRRGSAQSYQMGLK